MPICRQEQRKRRSPEKPGCKRTEFPAGKGDQNPHQQARLTRLCSSMSEGGEGTLRPHNVLLQAFLTSALSPLVQPDFRSLQTKQASIYNQEGSRKNSSSDPRVWSWRNQHLKAGLPVSPRGLLGARREGGMEEARKAGSPQPFFPPGTLQHSHTSHFFSSLTIWGQNLRREIYAANGNKKASNVFPLTFSSQFY